MALSSLEYLGRLSSDPASLTLQDQLHYLEGCLQRDRLSRDSRAQLYREIEVVRKRIANGETMRGR